MMTFQKTLTSGRLPRNQLMNQSLTLTLNRSKNQSQGMGRNFEHSHTTPLEQRLVSSNGRAEARCFQSEIHKHVLYSRDNDTSSYLKQRAWQTVSRFTGIDAISDCVEVVNPARPVMIASGASIAKHDNSPTPIGLVDVTACQLSSAGSQFPVRQL